MAAGFFMPAVWLALDQYLPRKAALKLARTPESAGVRGEGDHVCGELQRVRG